MTFISEISKITFINQILRFIYNEVLSVCFCEIFFKYVCISSAQIKTAESLYNSNPAEWFRLSLYNVQATSQTLLSVWRPVTFIFNCITLCQLFFQ